LCQKWGDNHVIGKLKGILDGIGEDYVLIDVGGVGYVAHVSGRTLQHLPSAGEALTLIIETHVREDMIRLYGFLNTQERDWFRVLQSVQGVGAKVALGILTALSFDVLASAILTGDKAMVARAPGVGPKLAARLVVELKDKVPVGDMVIGGLSVGSSGSAVISSPSALPETVADAISALVNLGYGLTQAQGAVLKANAHLGEEATTATLIRQGLKELAA
jgi:holliday junction DNA helicase RuvA